MSDAASPLGAISLAATTLYVSDFDAAVSWYQRELGLEPAMVGRDAEPYASFLVGGALVVLEPRRAALEAAPPGAESTTINLIVERNPADVRGDLLAQGVACGPLVESPHYLSFLMRDPDGNRFYVTRPVSEDGLADAAGAAGAASAAGAADTADAADAGIQTPPT